MRRLLTIAATSLIPAIFIAGFLAMAWIRSEQGHLETVYSSKIEELVMHKHAADPLADARARGSKVFHQYCQICHGEGGKADGFNSGKLSPPPRDFTQARFWDSTTDERLNFAVARGGPSVGKSVLMPAWGQTLTKSQIDDVIVYVRAFAVSQSTATGPAEKGAK
jgi:cytochrome c oxidase cbb3-type subunit 3